MGSSPEVSQPIISEKNGGNPNEKDKLAQLEALVMFNEEVDWTLEK